MTVGALRGVRFRMMKITRLYSCSASWKLEGLPFSTEAQKGQATCPGLTVSRGKAGV